MNYDELQQLRDRLIEASHHRPRSRFREILDRLRGQVDEKLNAEECDRSPNEIRKNGKAA